MATYITSKRLKNEYLNGNAKYIGIGLVGIVPKTFRVSAAFVNTKMVVVLQVVR